MKKIIQSLKYGTSGMFWTYVLIYKMVVFFRFKLFTDRYLVSAKFKKIFGVELQLSEPKTLNEKIQWLKLYDRNEAYAQYADKFAVRELIGNLFGAEYLIPLVFQTDNWLDIKEENLPDTPFIIKPNHSCGDYVIVRDKNTVDWRKLKMDCRFWMLKDYYILSQEYQYKHIKRKVVVELLLQDNMGRIPNDYKLHFINGKLVFIYVSVDREGENKRNIYDPNWQLLEFSWLSKEKNPETTKGNNIPRPLSLDKMKQFGEVVASRFPLVRVDFYDIEGHLYFGEVTLYHGSGFDIFTPGKYDQMFGRMLRIGKNGN